MRASGTGDDIDPAELGAWRRRALDAGLEADPARLAAIMADPAWSPSAAIDALTQVAIHDWDRPGGRAPACCALACRSLVMRRASGRANPGGDELPLLRNSAIGKLVAGAFEGTEMWVRLTLEALGETDPRSEPAIHGGLRKGLVREILSLSGRARAERIEQAVARLEEVMRGRQELASASSLARQSAGNGTQIVARQYAECAIDLAALYRHRLPGRPADNLERASELLDEALGLIDRVSAPALWAAAQHERGIVYSEQTERGLSDRVDDAVTSFRQALEVRTATESLADWAESTNALASALVAAAGHRDIRHIDEAIDLCQAARRQLEGTPGSDGALEARLLLTEGNARQLRARTGVADDLYRAIDLYGRALATPALSGKPAVRSLILHMRANAQWHLPGPERVSCLNAALADLEEARSLLDRDADPWAWSRIGTTLGGVLWQPELPDRPQNLDRAIEVLSDAAQVRTEDADPVGWARIRFQLGNCYADRMSADRAGDLREAIKCYETSLAASDPLRDPGLWADVANNLGTVLIEPPLGRSARDRKSGAECFQSVIDRIRVEQFPERVRRGAANLGHLEFSEENWEGASVAFGVAASAVESIVGIAATEIAQQSELRVVRDIYSRWAYALARLGRPLDAAVALESGRARGLRRALRLGRMARQSADENERDGVEATVRRIGELRARRPAQAAAYAAIADEIQQLLDGLSPQLGDLGLRDTGSADEILEACAPNGALLYVTATSAGGLAILVHRQEETGPVATDAEFLPEFASADLERLLFGASRHLPAGEPGWLPAQQALRDAYARRGTAGETVEEFADAVREVSAAMSQWATVVETTIEELRVRIARAVCGLLDARGTMLPSELVLIPCGHSVLLPIAAAFQLERCRSRADDEAEGIGITTAPSANALLAASRGRDASGSDRLLVVAGVGPSGSRLPSEPAETAAAASTFRSVTRLTGDGTPERVLEMLEGADVAHFTIHGRANPERPESSELQLPGGEPLTVGDLITRTARTKRLAVLSACESGIPGHDLPDEVISLPTSFLKAGFAGVVASQWLVPDLGASVLMERFYHYWRTHALPPPEALSRAQAWLRTTDPAAFLAYYEALADGRWDHDAPVPEGLRQAAAHFAIVLCSSEGPDQEALAMLRHPFTWGAFHFVGV